MKNTLFKALTLLFLTATATTVAATANAPWLTYTLNGFINLDHAEIKATAFPIPNPAMDNLVLNSGATILGFEGVAPAGGNLIPVTPYSEGGYTIVGNGLTEDGIFDAAQPDSNTNGTAVFGWCGGCDSIITLVLTKDDNSPFSMSSIDLSNLAFFSDPTLGNFSIEITGFDASNNVIASQILNVNFSAIGSAVAIPTLSNVALISLSLLMLLMGMRFRRKAN